MGLVSLKTSFCMFFVVLSLKQAYAKDGQKCDCSAEQQNLEKVLEELEKTRKYSEDNVKVAQQVSERQEKDLKQCHNFQEDINGELKAVQDRETTLQKSIVDYQTKVVNLEVELENLKASPSKAAGERDETVLRELASVQKERDSLKAAAARVATEKAAIKKEHDAAAQKMKGLEATVASLNKSLKDKDASSDKTAHGGKKSAGPLYSYKHFNDHLNSVYRLVGEPALIVLKSLVSDETYRQYHQLAITAKASYFDVHVRKHLKPAYERAMGHVKRAKDTIQAHPSYTKAAAFVAKKAPILKEKVKGKGIELNAALDASLNRTYRDSDVRTLIPKSGYDRLFCAIFVIAFLLCLKRFCKMALKFVYKLIARCFRMHICFLKCSLAYVTRSMCSKKTGKDKAKNSTKPKFQKRDQKQGNKSHKTNRSEEDDSTHDVNKLDTSSSTPHDQTPPKHKHK